MNNPAVVAFVASLSGLAAFEVLPEVGLGSALIVMFGVGWFLYGLTSPGRLMTTLGRTLHPPVAGLMAFLGSFVYFSFQGYPGPSKFLAAAGVGVLGVAVSITLFSTWNLGP